MRPSNDAATSSKAAVVCESTADDPSGRAIERLNSEMQFVEISAVCWLSSAEGEKWQAAPEVSLVVRGLVFDGKVCRQSCVGLLWSECEECDAAKTTDLPDGVNLGVLGAPFGAMDRLTQGLSVLLSTWSKRYILSVGLFGDRAVPISVRIFGAKSALLKKRPAVLTGVTSRDSWKAITTPPSASAKAAASG